NGGDPNFSTDQNPFVVYNNVGTYEVSLFVSNDEGSDTHTEIDFITVLDVPMVDFDATVIGFEADFTNTSTGGDFYEWDFGDGAFSSELNPFHAYDNPGEYEVILTVTNDCGAETVTLIVIIESTLLASFEASAEMGCAPLEVNFSDTSEGSPTFWEWTFPGGDPTTSGSSNPVVTYNAAGTYDVSLALGNDF
ncbi:MAG: PKD domain-containing protein, partial [Cytophagales bacterium]|nr:PKD domain-containing protein [Cytophagales bacterium]